VWRREVRAVRLVVAYDGAAFEGWQRQPGRRTVQGVLEERLAALVGTAVKLTGAGAHRFGLPCPRTGWRAW
jgi:tRNA pseudouridine38-40 synthase